jgi:membrane protein implicated in regulation of membrane protease activity
MPPRTYTFKTPTNPFLQILYFLVGGILLIGAIFMSAIVLAFAFGFAIVLGLVIMVRVWWLKRKFARSGRVPSDGPGQTRQAEVIEVEYTVVDERDERDG